MASFTTRTLLFITASVIVALAAPPIADASSGARSEAAAAHASRQVVILQYGSGYWAQNGSARVKVLQRRLARAGFAPGPIDGRYGPLTEQAVRGFQAASGLVVDGIAGPATQAAIGRSRASLYPGAGTLGASSKRVRVLQRGLARAGISPGPIDGRYGPLTEQAVRRFQTRHGLTVNGIAGPGTLGHLHTRLTAPEAQRARRHSGSRAEVKPHPHHGSRPRGQTNPPPANSAPSRHAVRGGGSSAVGSALFLVGLAVLLGLVTTWFAYRRRRRRPPIADGDTAPRWVPVTGPGDQLINSTEQREVPTQDPPSINQADLAAGLERPDDAEGWYRLALELQEQDQATAAAAAYRRADELGHGGAAASLGILHDQGGDDAAAQDCYRRADQRGDPDGAFNLAISLERENRLTAAAAAYRRADRRGHLKAAANLGVLLEGQGALEAAEECYRRADERGDPNGSYNLGVVLQEAGDYAAALQAYERARQLGDHQVTEMANVAARELEAELHRAPVTATEGAGRINS